MFQINQMRLIKEISIEGELIQLLEAPDSRFVVNNCGEHFYCVSPKNAENHYKSIVNNSKAILNR